MSAALGWGGTVNSPQTFSETNSGTIDWTNISGGLDKLRFNVLSAHTNLVFTMTWTPVTLGEKPRYVVQNHEFTSFGEDIDGPDVYVWTPAAGSGYFYISTYQAPFPGTLIITALVDGVLASNQLIFVVAANPPATGYGGYGSAAWSATASPKFWTQLVGVVES